MRVMSKLFAALAVVIVVAACPAGAQTIPGLTGGGSTPEPEAEASAPTDPVELLLQILQDEAARAQLVEQLQAVAAPEEEEAAAPEQVDEQPPTFGRRIADLSRGLATAAIESATSIIAAITRAPAALSGLSGEDFALLLEALSSLLLTIGATVAVFVALRTAAIPFYRRIGARAAERTMIGRMMLFIGTGLMDFGIVFLAWGIGYVVAWLFFGEANALGLRQVLYLNAFLAVELTKAVLRLLLSPSAGEFRMVNLGDWGARRLYRAIRGVISIVGYGFLLILPIVDEEGGFQALRSATRIMWLLAIIYLAAMTIYYRRAVGDWLFSQLGGSSTTGTGTVEQGAEDTSCPPESVPTTSRRTEFVRSVTRGWYWVVLVWLGWLMLVVISRPSWVATYVLSASGRIVAAISLGLLFSGLLGRLIKSGITLPHGVTARVPLLETRLNRYVPKILLVLRLIILASVLVYIFQVLNFINAGWVASEMGVRFAGALVSVSLILLVAFFLWLALTSWVDYRLNPSFGDVPTAREQTLLSLLRNAATIAILVLALMFALSEIGINIGPLVASAGVVGLAIGFGAQKMVQDIITGIFIQFEKAINVGDVVAAGGITGSVERLTVRSVSLRDLSGIYHIIPFSSVDTVSNYTRDFSYYLVDMGVAYREYVPEVKQAMHDAFQELRSDPAHGAFILGDLEWFGVDAFGDNAVVVKCRIKTWPAKQWGVGRAYNEIVKRIFDERGIEIPFPQRTMWFGESKEGSAPALRISGRMDTRTETIRAARAAQGKAEDDTPRITAPSDDGPASDPD